MIYLLLIFPLFFCLYHFTLYAKNIYRFRNFRGPPPLPLVGNLTNPAALSLIKLFISLKRVYGSIFTFFVFSHPYLVVCDPNAVRQILTDHKSFPKGESYTSGFAYVFGQGLVTSSNEKHKADRSRFSKYFIATNVALYLKMINDKTAEAVAELSENNPATGSFCYDMEHFFAPLTLRVFSIFCTGKDVFAGRRDKERDICRVVTEGSYWTGVVMFLKLPTYSMMPWTKALDKVLDTLRPEIMSIVDSKRVALKNGTCDTPDDCVSQMIQDDLSEKEIFEHMVTLLCAGHDTTAFFAAYMCLLFAQHQPEQQKAYEEIQRVMGDRTEVTADDIKDMVYLRKVMLETMRLYAIIPFLIRYAEEDFELKELKVTIPKGSNIMIPMSVVNRDSEAWPNPLEFDPERFEGTEKSVAKKGFFPFGYGSRVCIGNSLAQMESTVFVCHLLRQFKLDVDPSFKLQINAGISLTSASGLRLKMCRR